jgi:hypothetical protein
MANTIYPTNIQVVQLEDDFDLLTATGTPRVYNTIMNCKPEPSVAEFSDDPVALSITSYLIWLKNPRRRWVSVDEVGQVAPEARSMAQELRTYYLHRGTMKILQGHQPTEFQNKMMGLLADTRRLKTDELGLLYRLPYFWQEDMALDRVFEGATDPNHPEDPTSRYMTRHAPLTPIREILKSRKSGDMSQFWFSDSDGHRYMYAVRADNSLISVFRSLFKRESMQIKAQVTMSRLPGSHIQTSYWKLSGLELE